MQETFTRSSVDGWSPDSVLQDPDQVPERPAEMLSRRSSVLGYDPGDAAMLPSPLLAAHHLIGWGADEADSDSSSAMEVEAAINATLLPPGEGRSSAALPALQRQASAFQQKQSVFQQQQQHSAFQQQQQQQQQQPSVFHQQQQQQELAVQQQQQQTGTAPPGSPQQRQPWQQELHVQRQAAMQRQAFERQASSVSVQSLSRLSIGSSAQQQPPPACHPDADTAPAVDTLRQSSLLQVHQGGLAHAAAAAAGGAASVSAFALGAADRPFMLPTLEPEPLDAPWWTDDAAPQVTTALGQGLVILRIRKTVEQHCRICIQGNIPVRCVSQYQ